jgi:hypothetical protein
MKSIKYGCIAIKMVETFVLEMKVEHGVAAPGLLYVLVHFLAALHHAI